VATRRRLGDPLASLPKLGSTRAQGKGDEALGPVQAFAIEGRLGLVDDQQIRRLDQGIRHGCCGREIDDGEAAERRNRLGDDGPPNIVEPLDYVLSLAEAGLTEMRALILELRPESIATEGLVAAICRQVAATQARYGITVEAELCEEPDIAIEAKEAVYRIAQESLHNTVKHARATRVQLSLTCGDAILRLRIVDNGQGFDPSGDFPGHLGLRSMRERAQGIRGAFEIESSPGEGTTVTLTVPA